MHPLADFHRRRGAMVVETPHAAWVPLGAFSLQATPAARPVMVDRAEMETALRASRRLVAVAAVPHDTGLVRQAFVLRDTAYGPHSLQRQFRQQVTKAATHCRVAPLAWAALAHRGLPVNRALVRRGRERGAGIERDAVWRRYCEAAAATPGMEAWGVVAGDELLAYMVVFTWNGEAHGLQMHWSGRHPEWHPTHLLYYETARALMARPGMHAFYTGHQTMPTTPGVDRFKIHAGFRPEPIALAVVTHPRWRALLETLPAAVPAALRRRVPGLGPLEALEAAVLVRRADTF